MQPDGSSGRGSLIADESRTPGLHRLKGGWQAPIPEGMTTNAATLARGAFVFDRVEHQGWDPEAAACVSIAMHPLDQLRAGGKAERAVRMAAREFAREVRDLPEREALVAALGAFVTYITLARQVRDRTHESWWMQVAETIERKLEASGLGSTHVNVDIDSAIERESNVTLDANN